MYSLAVALYLCSECVFAVVRLIAVVVVYFSPVTVCLCVAAVLYFWAVTVCMVFVRFYAVGVYLCVLVLFCLFVK